MVKPKSPVKTIFRQRFYFLSETLIVLLGIVLFLLIPLTLDLFIGLNDLAKGVLYYLMKALLLVLAIPILFYVSNFALESKRKTIISSEDISPTKNFLNLFKISKTNFKYQILYGLLLLFLVFIPLDFLTYFFIPDTLEFTANLLIHNVYNSYLLQSYSFFLASVIIIQISVAIYEESFVRGFLSNRGSDYVPKTSAVIISSFYFGLGHFAYILSGIEVPIFFLFLWFVQAFIIGIILALFTLRKRWIFPAIFAHAVNNIITAHSIWNYLQGNDFTNLLFYVYIPLLFISLALFIWQFSRIKESIKSGFKELLTYFKSDKNIKEEPLDTVIRIMLDFLLGLIIFAIGIIIL